MPKTIQSRLESPETIRISWRSIAAVIGMAVVFTASVVILEALLSNRAALSETLSWTFTKIWPWLRAGVVWLIAGFAVGIAFFSRMVRQMPRDWDR